MANRNPYKRREFLCYRAWRAIPLFPNLSNEISYAMRAMGFDGFDNAFVLEIIGIRTQAEFAKRFKVTSSETLSEWNKILDADGSHHELRGKLNYALSFKYKS